MGVGRAPALERFGVRLEDGGVEARRGEGRAGHLLVRVDGPGLGGGGGGEEFLRRLATRDGAAEAWAVRQEHAAREERRLAGGRPEVGGGGARRHGDHALGLAHLSVEGAALVLGLGRAEGLGRDAGDAGDLRGLSEELERERRLAVAAVRDEGGRRNRELRRRRGGGGGKEGNSTASRSMPLATSAESTRSGEHGGVLLGESGFFLPLTFFFGLVFFTLPTALRFDARFASTTRSLSRAWRASSSQARTVLEAMLDEELRVDTMMTRSGRRSGLAIVWFVFGRHARQVPGATFTSLCVRF